MYKTSGLIFAVLAVIVSHFAYAESSMVAYANYSYADHCQQEESVMDDMDVILPRDLYEIQQETSSMRFQVNSPIGEVSVKFDDFAGSFSMTNSDSQRGLASIQVNAQNMNADRDLVGMLLKSEGFLNVESFPSMQFVGSSFEWFGDRHALMKGYMTIKNTTRLVTFYVELLDSGFDALYSERVTVEATATIKRSEFGIDMLLPFVSDDVNLYISINAVKRDTAISMM